MAKPKAKQSFVDPDRGPLFTARFVIALLLILAGIAWIVFYYVQARGNPPAFPPVEGTPRLIADLGDWNYAHRLRPAPGRPDGRRPPLHPARPRPRRRGRHARLLPHRPAVDLHLLRLLRRPLQLPIFNDLGQWNLVVGIAFMAVGFTYATRWDEPSAGPHSRF